MPSCSYICCPWSGNWLKAFCIDTCEGSSWWLWPFCGPKPTKALKWGEPFLTCHDRLQCFAATERWLLDHCGRWWGCRCSPGKAPTRSWWATMSYPHPRGWGPEGEGANFFQWWRLLLAATCILQDVTIWKAAGRYHCSSLDKNGAWRHRLARWPQTGHSPNWWYLATCPHV